MTSSSSPSSSSLSRTPVDDIDQEILRWQRREKSEKEAIDGIKEILRSTPDLSIPTTDKKIPILICATMKKSSINILQLLLRYSPALKNKKPNVNAENAKGMTPLLTALLNCTVDNTDFVRSLLAYGATPKLEDVVYDRKKGDCLQELQSYRQRMEEELKAGLKFPEIRAKFGPIPVNESVYYWLNYVKNLNVSKAAMTNLPPGTLPAEITGIVGQRLAKFTFRNVVNRWLITDKHDRPIVVAFCGFSGHGKTELCRQFIAEAGNVLNMTEEQLLLVDCPNDMRDANSAFGFGKGYEGGTESKPINSFLVRNNNRHSILILDEFDRCPKAVHESLMNTFDRGTYRDRVNEKNISNVTKLLIILTTNAADPAINNYCSTPEGKELISDANTFQNSISFYENHHISIRKIIQQSLKTPFSFPVLGRIAEYVPFVYFTPTEANVVADSQVRENIIWPMRKLIIPDVPNVKLIQYGYMNIRIIGHLSAFVSLEYVTNEEGKSIGVRGMQHRLNTFLKYGVISGVVNGTIGRDLEGIDDSTDQPLDDVFIWAVPGVPYPMIEIKNTPPKADAELFDDSSAFTAVKEGAVIYQPPKHDTDDSNNNNNNNNNPPIARNDSDF